MKKNENHLLGLSVSLYLLAIGILAAGILFFSTPVGIGLGFDSVWYISAARNLLSGLGLGRLTCTGFKPLTLWPPLYPLLLAIFSFFKIDTLLAARIISAVGYGCTVFLSGLSVAKISKGFFFPIMGSCLILLSSTILRTFSWAMSEALYIPLFLGVLLLINEFLENKKETYLILGAIAIGMSIITRYIGICLLIIVSINILADNKDNLNNKIRNLAILFLIGVIPLGIWWSFNQWVVGSATSRTLGIHFPTFGELDYFIKQMAGWFLPSVFLFYRVRILFVFFSMVFAGVLLIFIFIKRRKDHANKYNIPMLFLLHTIIYPIFVISTIMLITPSISTVDERIMVPVLVGELILIVLAGSYIWASKNRAGQIIFFLFAIILIAFYLPQQYKNIIVLHGDGQGYASRNWKDSPSSDVLKQFSANMLYTNDFQAVYFLSGNPSCIIPTKIEDLEPMKTNIKNSDGIIVIFGQHLPEFLALEIITEDMNLIYEYQDVRIFRNSSYTP